MPEVVDSRQSTKQDLATDVKMPEVGPRERSAGVATAILVHRKRVLVVPRLLDQQLALRGKQAAIAGIARGHDAIHHVHAARDVFGQFRRRSDTHHIARPVRWQQGRGRLRHLHAKLARLAYAQAPESISVSVELDQRARAYLAQIGEYRALNDPKTGVSGGFRLHPLGVMRAAARSRTYR